MSFAVQESQTLETTTCPNCGVLFAVPAHLIGEKRRTAGSLTCPNGHSLGWHETESDRLKRKLAEAERQRDDARAEAARKDRLLTAQKAQATKFKNRVANGVCPCCNRTFVKLGRHMATKHPDYKAQEVGS